MKRVNCIKFTVMSVANNSKGTCSDSSLALLKNRVQLNRPVIKSTKT